jgi:hypothetical protein
MSTVIQTAIRIYLKRPYNYTKRLSIRFEIKLYVYVLNNLNLPHVLYAKPSSTYDLALTYSTGTTLYECMQKSGGEFMIQYPNTMFQIIWTLFILKRAGIVHHDLHYRNIMIERRHYYSYYEYMLTESCVFRGWSNIHVYIIDFDYATKITTPTNTYKLHNTALDCNGWRIGLYNSTPVDNVDWFTFLFYLSTYSTYPQYIDIFQLPDIRPLLNKYTFVYPGRPMTTSGYCIHSISKYIGTPLCILLKWSLRNNVPSTTINNHNIVPIPKYTMNIYNQTVCKHHILNMKTHCHTHHLLTGYCVPYYKGDGEKGLFLDDHKQQSVSFGLLFVWCGVFRTYPKYIHCKNTSYFKNVWILYTQYPSITEHPDLIYICCPHKRCCIQLHRNVENTLQLTFKKCLYTYDVNITHDRQQTTASHTWCACMLDDKIKNIGLKWEHLIMPIHNASLAIYSRT